MTYRCGIGAGMRRIGLEPCEPHIVCDGCGSIRPVANRSHFAPAWFINGKAPPGWRSLRKFDGSKRWDLCPKCWKDPAEYNPRERGDGQ